MNKLWMVSILLLSLFLTMTVTAADEPVTSSLKVKFYGKIKADMSYDDSRTASGTYVKWADAENGSQAKPKNDEKFNMTARETRFGFNLSGPKVMGADVSGKIEVDFFGGYTNSGAAANNKGELYMRHAFGKMNWAEKDTAVVFGQTWDIVSPLNPTTLNYPVLWWCGNTGYRRSQLSFHQGMDLGADHKLKIQAGILDQLGSGGYTNTGGDSGGPNLQARVAWTFPIWGSQSATLGVAGMSGEEKNDGGTTAGTRRLDTYGTFVDLVLPIVSWVSLKGEYFTGLNLATVNGGIGQGINTTGSTHQGVRSSGGWFMAAFGPWTDWSFNLGYGIDDPRDAHVSGMTAAKYKNQCIFGNVLYKASKHLTFGLELSNWVTEYANDHNARANRIQASAIYSFY